MPKSRGGSLRRRRIAVSTAVATVLSTLITPPAPATTYYWNTTTAGTWATGNNWSDDPNTAGNVGIVPLSTDTAFFNQSSVNGAEIIQFDVATAISGITFANTGTTSFQ